MTYDLFTFIALIGSLIAGFFGALTGLGGGVLLIPLLTLVCHVDIHYAIGASLVSIIATSSGAAAAFVKNGLVDIRIAMFLSIATTLGAILGAYIAIDTPTNIISIIFGTALLLTTLTSWVRSRTSHVAQASHTKTQNFFGFLLMLLAGTLSGLLGIGSGAIKVLALDTVMGMPFRVATATSNLMIGVTAAASASLYLTKGYVNPTVTFPVMIGVLMGAFIGAKMITRVHTKLLRHLFTIFVIIISLQMVYHGIVSR